MAAIPCPKCGKLRKVDQIFTPDGILQPDCYNCGDKGGLEPYEKEQDDPNSR